MSEQHAPQMVTLGPWLITVAADSRVYWSSGPVSTARFDPSAVRSMDINRFQRYGYHGGKLGKRMRRERSAIATKLREDGNG